MKVIILTLFIAFSVAFSQPRSDFVLKPCYGSNILNSQTSESDLIKIVGSKNVQRVERYYDEGTDRVIGSVFFKDSPS